MQSSQLVINQLRDDPELIRAKAKEQFDQGETAISKGFYNKAIKCFEKAFNNLEYIGAETDDISLCFEKIGDCYLELAKNKQKISEISSLIEQIKTGNLDTALSKIAQSKPEFEQKQSEEPTEKLTKKLKSTSPSNFNKPTMSTSIDYEYEPSKPAPNLSAPPPILSMFGSFIKKHPSTPVNKPILTSSSTPTLSG